MSTTAKELLEVAEANRKLCVGDENTGRMRDAMNWNNHRAAMEGLANILERLERIERRLTDLQEGARHGFEP